MTTKVTIQRPRIDTSKQIKIIETEDEPLSTETEIVEIPKRVLTAFVEERNETYNQAYQEGIILSGKLREEAEIKKAYQEALDKEKKEKQLYLNKCNVYEKELNAHRSKANSKPEINTMLIKMKENQEYLNKNKDKLVDDYYKKNCVSKVEQIRKQLGLE